MRSFQRSAEEWWKIHQLFQAALDLPREEREAFLETACAERPQVRKEVEELLGAAEAAEPWMERSRSLIRDAAREAFSAPDDPRDLKAGAVQDGRIGPYRLVRELARGGMGTVYLAERADGRSAEPMALKLMRRGLDTEDFLARFLTERRILGRLSHPNIARLLDGGATDDGRPYFLMEYVEGQPITEYCDSHRLSIPERLKLFVTVGRAVQHAHSHRIVHRDLKPSNILVAADGSVKLLDFGIAKVLDGSRGAAAAPRTRTGVRLMTPEYASPEQVRGEPVTPATDVYQLGALLYMLLTAQSPHQPSPRSTDRIEHAICDREPTPPSALAKRATNADRRSDDPPHPEVSAWLRSTAAQLPAPELHGDLDTIVLKALSKEPERRYSSAKKFVEDIERYLSGEPIRARPDGWGYRARRFLRRHPRTASAVSTVLGAAVALVVLAAAGPEAWHASPTPARVVAVGEIEFVGGADSTAVVQTLPDMLATNLARASGVQVVSTRRLYEVLAQLRDQWPDAHLEHAARQVGCNQLLRGQLDHTREGRLRLTLQRVHLPTGQVRGSYRIVGDDPFSLADGAAKALLADLGLSLPATGIAEVITSSALAYRFYEEGLRAYYDGDNRAAQRLFSAALAEDSSFAMAAYYRAQSHRDIDHAAFRSDLGRAYRFAAHASDRERLLIRAAWAQHMDEPAQRELAESLTTRYPDTPDGHLFLGRARLWDGEFLQALPHLRRVWTLDSLSLRGDAPACRACDALHSIVRAYLLADSLAAAEREARRWVELQPGSARAWQMLASTLEYQGRESDALLARNRAASLRSDNPRDPVYPAVLAIRAGDLVRAERLLAERSVPGATLVQQNVLWYQVLILRYQGRFSAALEVARRYRRMVREAEIPAQRRPWESVLEAQVLQEMGRAREAAALWQSMAEYPYEPASSARTARHRAWTLTHAATALADAGDTLRLSTLADTIEQLGRRSAYGRDPRLHHFVRGLLWAARGDTAAAAAAYRRAIFSTTAGHARINLELGRSLLALNRPREAAEFVGAALRGPLDASNLYANRTDLHEVLGYAWEAAGRRDSAAAHFQRVLAAWERADSRLHARREAVRQRLRTGGEATDRAMQLRGKRPLSRALHLQVPTPSAAPERPLPEKEGGWRANDYPEPGPTAPRRWGR